MAEFTSNAGGGRGREGGCQRLQRAPVEVCSHSGDGGTRLQRGRGMTMGWLFCHGDGGEHGEVLQVVGDGELVAMKARRSSVRVGKVSSPLLRLMGGGGRAATVKWVKLG